VTAKVLVVGFDACEVTLVDRWADAGRLPNFARLRSRSRVFDLDSPMTSLPGAIWPEISTGRTAARDAHFYVPQQLRSGESRLRATRPDEMEPEHYFWTVASRAGRRVAVIDPVQAVPAPRFNGVQLIEWGLHDRTFDVQSDPPEFLEALRARHGDHPVQSCDRHGESVAGYRALVQGLLAGVAAKGEFASALLAREPWDLFHCTFSESHCAGHQFWHFTDPRHPWHARAIPPDLRDALFDVYQGIDAALGKVLDAAGDDAQVLAVFSHGMDLYFDGPQLLPEFLARLGYASGGSRATGIGLRMLRRYVTYLPRPVKAAIKRVVRSRALQAPIAAAGCLVDPFQSRDTRAAQVSNNRCGGIRLNLRGREPYGSIEPGIEAQRALADLARELRALRDPASGEPIVADVFTAEARFGADRHRDLPDLMCVFRTDLGMLETCESPAVGRIRAPIYHPHAPRTGDHTPHSACWASGDGIVPASATGRGNVQDIAPTVLALLGLARPDWMDGRSLDVVGATPSLTPMREPGVAHPIV
jgi:predicted AlkP superfamily phosphohydrolase/phosphomutase